MKETCQRRPGRAGVSYRSRSMAIPRKGTETGHHMRMIDVSTRLKNTPSYKLPSRKHCQTCNQRKKLMRHPVGLHVCASCTTQINSMLKGWGLQPHELRNLSPAAKQRWIQVIDEMHLYQSQPARLLSEPMTNNHIE